MLLIFRMGYCSGQGRVIDQGGRVKGKELLFQKEGFFASGGGY